MYLKIKQLYLRFIETNLTYMADINRLKVVLAEKKRTGKWLADSLGKDTATISKWCTNTAQPSLETLLAISELLEMNIQDLLWPTSVGNN
jgi:DNA-binding Xre family transcriptional regulator